MFIYSILERRLKITQRIYYILKQLQALDTKSLFKLNLHKKIAIPFIMTVAVILLGSETLELQLGKRGKNREIAESIKNNANRLKHFFDNLLEIEKIENGILKIHPQKQEINLILR